MDLFNSKADVSQDSHSEEAGASRSSSKKHVASQLENSSEGSDPEAAVASTPQDVRSIAELDENRSSEPEPEPAKSETSSRLTPEQVAFRQKKKNDYAANELEGWPLYQLFVDYPQLFLGLATVGVFVFLLILQVHFLISLLLAVATPFGVIKLWRENPKALLVTVYSFGAVIVLASAILIYSVANADDSARQL